MKPPRWWPRRRRPPILDTERAPERLIGAALIHLGTATRAAQEGDMLRAVRHLALAAESITALIDAWTTGTREEPL